MTGSLFIVEPVKMALPGQVGKLGVDRTGDDLCVDGVELVYAITESDDLSGANKCAAKNKIKKSTITTPTRRVT